MSLEHSTVFIPELHSSQPLHFLARNSWEAADPTLTSPQDHIQDISCTGMGSCGCWNLLSERTSQMHTLVQLGWKPRSCLYQALPGHWLMVCPEHGGLATTLAMLCIQGTYQSGTLLKGGCGLSGPPPPPCGYCRAGVAGLSELPVQPGATGYASTKSEPSKCSWPQPCTEGALLPSHHHGEC